jgi:hypothetical protein
MNIRCRSVLVPLFIRLITLLLVASVAPSSPPPQSLYENPGAASYFIDTAVEWRSVQDGSPRKLTTAQEPVTGQTTIVGFYASGALAVISGYFDYHPRTKTFAFVPSGGLTVHLGKWKRTEAGQLEVEQRFAYSQLLATAVGCKTLNDCYAFPYNEPVTTSTWSVSKQSNGTVTSVESPMKDASAPRHYVAVRKLRNPQELINTIKLADKELSQNLDSPR